MSATTPEDDLPGIDGEPLALESPRRARAQRSLREEADGHLWAGFAVLAVLSLALLALAYLLTATQPSSGEDLPVGAQVRHTPLPLSPEERTRFDQSVFGEGDREPAALGDLRLPPRVPDLTARPWTLSSHSELSAPEVKAALEPLRRCSDESTPCAREVIDRALTAVSERGADGTPCSTQPRTGGDVQVPVGLHALVLGWLPECREQALARFKVFQEKITYNMRTGGMRPAQGAVGLLYARFEAAKLAEDPRHPGSAAFFTEIRSIRKLILDTPALREPWEHLQELPQWGLSMAGIQAEWLMAEAREAARQGGGSALAASLAPLLDAAVPERLRAAGDLAAGQGRLKITWCALALRAQVQGASSDFCLSALAAQRSLPSMRCALLARGAVLSGRWEVTGNECAGDRDAPAETSASGVFERLAANHALWNEVLEQYQHGGMDAEERARLHTYLTAYASASGNSPTWLWAQHPEIFFALAAGLLLLAAGWAVWLWAFFVRRRTLRRFLPPPLARDG